MTLASHGVLFLDELAEFARGTLEALRQPLDDWTVCIVHEPETLLLACRLSS